MPISSNIFDVRDFGAALDGVTDDTVAFQAAVNAAQALTGTPYGPRAEVYCPVGYLFKTTSVIRCSVPIKLNIGSLNLYYNTTGCAWQFNEYAPVGASSYWDINLAGVYAMPGAGPFPLSINMSGSIGVNIRHMTFSRVRIGQLQGFTRYGLELDGRGITYPAGGPAQVIQHNTFDLGQIANCGVGIKSYSADAATSSVQANLFNVQNVYQNFINYSDGDASYHASTSNSLRFNAMDNAKSIGLDLWSPFSNIYVGFTGQPGTSLKWNPGANHNRVIFGNTVATGIVVVNSGGGTNNAVQYGP